MKTQFALLSAVLLVVAPAFATWNPSTGGDFTWSGKAFTTHTSVKLLTVAGGSTGGPFVVDVQYGSLPVWGTTLFNTFCVESQITFNPGVTYWATVEPVAYSGGAGAAGDPLSDVTEYIYQHYLAGAYSALQWGAVSQAIWFAEGESGGSRNSIFIAAADALGYTGTSVLPTALAPSTSVLALNLWQVDGSGVAIDKQSHAIAIPVPAAALLGVLGLGLVGWVKRRLA